MNLRSNNESVTIINKVRGTDGRIHEIRIEWARGTNNFSVYLDGSEVSIFTSAVETPLDAAERMTARLADPQLIPWNCEEHYKMFERAD